MFGTFYSFFHRVSSKISSAKIFQIVFFDISAIYYFFVIHKKSSFIDMTICFFVLKHGNEAVTKQPTLVEYY